MKRYKFYLYGISLSFLAILPLKTGAYDFNEKSGLKETAEGTGHAESGLFTPGNLAGGIGVIINAVLSFLGVIFLLLAIYGGYLWMTASGNEEQVSKAKKVLSSAIVGLIIVVAAYTITAMVGTYFTP
ncbi:MAG: hypothetical protein ACOCVY_03245 [Patescibacteria group bacterium]